MGARSEWGNCRKRRVTLNKAFRSGIAEVSDASPLPEQPPYPNTDVASLLPSFVFEYRDGGGEAGEEE